MGSINGVEAEGRWRRKAGVPMISETAPGAEVCRLHVAGALRGGEQQELDGAARGGEQEQFARAARVTNWEPNRCPS